MSGIITLNETRRESLQSEMSAKLELIKAAEEGRIEVNQTIDGKWVVDVMRPITPKDVEIDESEGVIDLPANSKEAEHVLNELERKFNEDQRKELESELREKKKVTRLKTITGANINY